MSRMKNDYDFAAGVLVGQELYFNRFRLTIDFYTNSDVIADHNTAVERMNYFIHEIVSRSIFVDETNYEAIINYTTAGIPVLTVPNPGPFDPLVQAVIVTKLNSILEDTLVISEAEMVSTVGGYMTYVWDAADDEDEIHNFVDEDDEVKWWASSEPRFSSYPDGTDVDDIDEKDNLQFVTWEMLGLEWLEDREDEDEDGLEIEFIPEKKTDGKIIKISDFNKPPKK